MSPSARCHYPQVRKACRHLARTAKKRGNLKPISSGIQHVVFEARAGHSVSINLEARRIADGLHTPDRTPEQLLKVIRCRRAADGEGESVVVTLQDLAPLEELDRQRAGFVAMVSHMLRTPLTSILGSTTTLLEQSGGLEPAERREFYRIADEQARRMRGLIGGLTDRSVDRPPASAHQHSRSRR